LSTVYVGKIKPIILKKRLEKIHNWICQLPILKTFLEWTKKYSPPGFSGVSIHDLVQFVIEETQKDNLTTRANSVAYSLFIAIFPAIIFLFTLLPLIPIIQDYTLMLNENTKDLLPKSTHDYIFNIIHDLTSIKREGLLSIGFILSLFFSSNGMLTLMSGFDKSYNHTFTQRGYFKKRLIAIVLTVVLAVLFIISIVLLVLGGQLFEWLDASFVLPQWFIFIFSAAFRWGASILLIYTGISLIYQYGPSMYRKSRFINIGAITATIFFLIVTFAFSFVVNNFSRYNEIYGSIGALIVTMLWFQINSFILLVGFELNASLAVNKALLRAKRLDVL